MKTNPKRPIPIIVQLQALEIKNANKNRAHEHRPIWRILLDGNLNQSRPTRIKAHIEYGPDVANNPIGMNEALQRHHHLQKWLKDGGKYEEFIKMFGPER